MNIREGEVFNNTTDGVDFTVKKILNDLVVLESQDGERQILTGLQNLTSRQFFLKRTEEKILNQDVR